MSGVGEHSGVVGRVFGLWLTFSGSGEGILLGILGFQTGSKGEVCVALRFYREGNDIYRFSGLEEVG